MFRLFLILTWIVAFTLRVVCFCSVVGGTYVPPHLRNNPGAAASSRPKFREEYEPPSNVKQAAMAEGMLYHGNGHEENGIRNDTIILILYYKDFYGCLHYTLYLHYVYQ